MKLPSILLLWITPILFYAHNNEKDSLSVKKENPILEDQPVSSFYQFPELDKSFPFAQSIKISSAPEFTTESIQREFGPPSAWVNDNRLKAKVSFEKIDTEDRWVSSFSNTHLKTLPVGVKHDIGGMEYQLGFVKAKFHKQYTELTVFVKIVLPKTDSDGRPIEIFFGADNVKLTHEGGIIGDASLILLGDMRIPFNGGNWLVYLKGGLEFHTGDVKKKTFVTIDCDGVKEVGIEGGVEFSRNLLLPVNENGKVIGGNARVTGGFSTTVIGMHDLYASVTLTPFVLTNHKKGFMFSVTEATLDFSDIRSPDNDFPNFYHDNGLLLPDRNTWRGIYVKQLQVCLPEAFMTSDSAAKNERVCFEAVNMIIDSHGVSGEFSVDGLFPLEKGITSKSSGWQYSLDKLGVIYAADHLIGGQFEGKIKLPLSGEKDKGLEYKGLITDSEYKLTVSAIEEVDFSMLKAKVRLYDNSEITFVYSGGDKDPADDTNPADNNKEGFCVSANLSGMISISASQKESLEHEGETVKNEDGKDEVLKANGIRFENMRIQSCDGPFISVEYLGYEDEIRVAGFPVSVSDIGFVSRDREIGIKFKINVALMKDAFSASGGVGIYAKQLQDDKNHYVQKWKYNRLALSTMTVAGDLGAMKFDGSLDIMKNDPVYGNGFRAKVNASFFKMSDDGAKGDKSAGISCAAIFGKTRTVILPKEGTNTEETTAVDPFRYWYIDAAVTGLKIPAGPGLTITGFAGGAFYRMSRKPGEMTEFSPSGLTFIPDHKTRLGVKAMVFAAVPDPKTLSINAGFEINFNENYGVRNLGFFGEFVAMKAITIDNPMDKLTGKLSGIVDKESTLSIVTAPFTEKAETAYPSEIVGGNGIPAQPGVTGRLGVNFDFENKTFKANLDLSVNVAGGFVQGREPGGGAGKGEFYIGPKEGGERDWYVKMGTPSNRLGVRMGVGSVFIESGAYFMAGNIGDEASPPPPPEVAQLLGVDASKLDYMRDENSMAAGKGIAFGSDFKIDTGDINFLLLYARFRAGLGFDIMLKDYQGARCINTGEEVGINGWYANGQAYAYLQGEMGIKVKLFSLVKKIPIIQGSAAILMQAKGPNPFWMKGYAAGSYDLLGGTVKGAYRLEVEVGEVCDFEETNPMGDIKMISDLTPKDNDNDIDVFAAPQGTFVMKVGTPITISEKGGDKTYKIVLDKFTVTDQSGKKIEGKLEWANTKDRVTFMPDDIFPPTTRLKAMIEISFQEKIQGVYKDIVLNGKKAVETLERNFTTGTAPDYIPLHNIEYAYPVVDQQRFYKGESTNGYIQLERGQDYLFDDTQWQSEVKFMDQSGKILPAKFNYNTAENKVVYTLPKVGKETQYTMSIISTTKNPEDLSNDTKTVTETTDFGEDNTMDIKKKKASIVLSEGEVERITYEFKTSKYKKFADKINAIKVTNGLAGKISGSSDMLFLYNIVGTYEGFGVLELVGNQFTAHTPMVSYEATLDDAYYTQDIEPLVYANYPISGTYTFKQRDVALQGAPPVRALLTDSKYLTSLEHNVNKSYTQNSFPFTYDLPQVYKGDLMDLRNQAYSDLTDGKITGTHPIMRVTQGGYKIMKYGKYKVKLQYMLPGGVKGSEATIKFNNPIK